LKDKNKPAPNNSFLTLFNRFKSSLGGKDSSTKSRITVYLIFVLFSGILWLSRALDDNFVASINYPVRYENLPKNKILIGTPPNKIKLRVRGNGYSLLSTKANFKTPLNFNINSFLLYSQANDSMSVYILTHFAREALTEELSKKNSDLAIVSIQPDTIFFTFTRTRSKKVPVYPVVNNEGNLFARQHMLNGKIISTPDSVEITGPSTIIDTIHHIATQAIYPSVLNDTLNKKANLIKIDQVQISHSKVKITIPVDRFTEIAYELPVYAKNVPDSINMKLFPRKVTVSFNITHSNIPNISEADFNPYVNYNDLEENSKTYLKRIPVRMDSVPDIAKSERITPSSLEFINELKND
jgi:YbbR domain-containing protein